MLSWGCYKEADIKGTYVFDDNSIPDTIYLKSNHKYLRNYMYKDTLIKNVGEWYLEDKRHISFSDWSDKNEQLLGSDGSAHTGLCYFVLGSSYFQFNGEIMLDDEGKHFTRIK
jgi:hypothetical protein